MRCLNLFDVYVCVRSFAFLMYLSVRCIPLGTEKQSKILRIVGNNNKVQNFGALKHLQHTLFTRFLVMCVTVFVLVGFGGAWVAKWGPGPNTFKNDNNKHKESFNLRICSVFVCNRAFIDFLEYPGWGF